MIVRIVRQVARNPLIYLSTALAGCVVYFSLINPQFATIADFKGIGAGAAVTAIAAIGVTAALAAGCIDFSITGNMALTGVVGVWLGQHLGWGAAIPLTIFAAACIGLVTGIIIVRFGINPFIATLASANVLTGLAYLVGGAQGIFINGGPFITLGQGDSFGVPNTVITTVILGCVAWLGLTRARIGRALLASGANPEAARLAGINVRAVTVLGYVASATAAGIAGMLLAGRTGGALPSAEAGQQLVIFSAVILGGTSLWGGRVSVVGSVLGVVLLQVLFTGFTLQQVSPYWQMMIEGALLIAAVALVQERRDQRLVQCIRKGRGLARRVISRAL